MSATKSLVRKYYDVGPTSVSSSPVYTGGATGFASGIADDISNASYWLTGLAQGATDNDRVGISISIESLDIRVQISPDTVTSNGHGHLRMIMFADTECQGAPPSTVDLLTQITSVSGVVMSMLNPSYFGRFKVIEDKHWQWSTAGVANSLTDLSNTPSIYHESHHDLKGMIAQWDVSNSSAIANARKGHIFLYWYWQAVTVAAGGVPTVISTNPPAIQFVTRIRYRDA